MTTSISDSIVDLVEDKSIDDIRTDILSLRQKLDANLPMSDLLIRIHKDLFSKPECFAVLDEDEIAQVIKGIQIHVRREIVSGKDKPKTKKNYSMDDFDL